MKAIDHLGPLIGKSRIKYGLTREQVCNRASERGVNLSPAHLAEIEAKQRRVPCGIMYALLETLGVTLCEIEQEFHKVQNGSEPDLPPSICMGHPWGF